VTKIEQAESELRNLSQAGFVKMREWLDDSVEMNWNSLKSSKIPFSGQSATWPLEQPRVYMS
jgi:hypothetical protein